MINWFEFKGLSSDRFRELIVSELPPISKPQMRYIPIYIDGVPGATVEELGYDMVEKTILIGLTSMEHIDEILSWLTGSGDITFFNEPNKIYKGSIFNQINFEILERCETAPVTFLCNPYKYIKDESNVVATSAGTYKVYNNGTVESLPLIEIESTNTISITLNGSFMCSVGMNTFNPLCRIDSETENAYTKPSSKFEIKNGIFTGEFPILIPGENTMIFEGVLSKLTITPRSRFI